MRAPISFFRCTRAVTPVPSMVILALVSVSLVLFTYHIAINRIQSSNPGAEILVAGQLTPFGSKAILTVHVYNSGSTPITLKEIRLYEGLSNIGLNPNPMNLNVELKPGQSFESAYIATPASMEPGKEYLLIVRAVNLEGEEVEGITEVILL